MENQYIKKYDFWKNMIKYISFLLCVVFYFIGYKIILIFIQEIGPLLTVVSWVWLFICFIFSFAAFNIMCYLNFKEIAGILMNACDSKLYCNITYKLYTKETSKTIRSILLTDYIDGLRENGDYDVLKQVIKKNEKDLKNNLSVLVAKLEMSEEEEFEEHYKALMDGLQTILKKSNRFANIAKERIARYYASIEHYKAYNLRYHHKYEEALTIYKRESEYFRYKIERVKHNYNIGYCLFKLDKYGEAREYFDEAIREGNTLYIVSKAKEYNEIINQSIRYKG